MRIADAHHHLWDPVSGTSGIGYRWLREIGAPKPFGDPTPIQRDYLAPEFSAESAHDLVASVHVQVDGALPDPVAETRWLDALWREHGLPGAIVAFCDLSRDDAPSMIEAHMAASSRLRGIRHIVARTPGRPDISFAPEEWLDHPVWRRNYAALADYGLSFDLQLHPSQMERAAGLAGGHPDVPVVIDHAGSPFDLSPAGLDEWSAGMERLAALPHVDCKLSGLGMFDPDWTARSMAPVIEGVIAMFGPRRAMHGSNFPVDKLFGPYDRLIGAILEAMDGAVEEDRDAVLRGTAMRAYRIAQEAGTR